LIRAQFSPPLAMAFLFRGVVPFIFLKWRILAGKSGFSVFVFLLRVFSSSTRLSNVR
jgi:hypothetical protein